MKIIVAIISAITIFSKVPNENTNATNTYVDQSN